jgi:hypothetical protein
MNFFFLLIIFKEPQVDYSLSFFIFISPHDYFFIEFQFYPSYYFTLKKYFSRYLLTDF